MQDLGEIYAALDAISPFVSQESWDNSGILLGKKSQKIAHIFLALEATLDIAESLPQNSLLITHHPLIFAPLKNICEDFYPNEILAALIRKNAALIALHTNFDKSHLNAHFVREILGFKDFRAQNFSCEIDFNAPFSDLLARIQAKMPDSRLKFCQASDFVRKIHVICGAGMGEFNAIRTRDSSAIEAHDCVITGDIKYHESMAFCALKISQIDVGHFDSECHFAPLLAQILAQSLQKTARKCIILHSPNPFQFTKDAHGSK